MQQNTHLQYPRQAHVICVVNSKQKPKQKTHLHSNCNITDAEKETIFIWLKLKGFKMDDNI